MPPEERQDAESVRHRHNAEPPHEHVGGGDPHSHPAFARIAEDALAQVEAEDGPLTEDEKRVARATLGLLNEPFIGQGHHQGTHWRGCWREHDECGLYVLDLIRKADPADVLELCRRLNDDEINPLDNDGREDA